VRKTDLTMVEMCSLPVNVRGASSLKASFFGPPSEANGSALNVPLRFVRGDQSIHENNCTVNTTEGHRCCRPRTYQNHSEVGKRTRNLRAYDEVMKTAVCFLNKQAKDLALSTSPVTLPETP
jgi:hypothetical protein